MGNGSVKKSTWAESPSAKLIAMSTYPDVDMSYNVYTYKLSAGVHPVHPLRLFHTRNSFRVNGTMVAKSLTAAEATLFRLFQDPNITCYNCQDTGEAEPPHIPPTNGANFIVLRIDVDPDSPFPTGGIVKFHCFYLNDNVISWQCVYNMRALRSPMPALPAMPATPPISECAASLGCVAKLDVCKGDVTGSFRDIVASMGFGLTAAT
jgi:hypothetical protein